MLIIVRVITKARSFMSQQQYEVRIAECETKIVECEARITSRKEEIARLQAVAKDLNETTPQILGDNAAKLKAKSTAVAKMFVYEHDMAVEVVKPQEKAPEISFLQSLKNNHQLVH